ncbi:MAG: hypothetical protein P1T08_10775 [Acidimicrobiia bacterium]|nr:hypothetical protein [Acidimicrobiia bacterium]
MKKVLFVALTALVVIILISVTADSERVLLLPDAFSADSIWNTPLPEDVPLHPRSDEMISFLASDNALQGCITLAGAENNWGMPIYVADADSPTYSVTSTKYPVPPEFASLRIPRRALPADTSDAEMVIYDLDRGVVAQLSKARYDGDRDAWTVSGGSIAYLESNGLDGSLPASDERRNRGTFRGYNGAVAAVHYDDVADGVLDNVVKIGVHRSHVDAVSPMVGSDGDLVADGVPRQGMRLRIRPELDLTTLGLAPQALIIATGLQEYGAIIGDSTGGAIVLMLEDTDRSGSGGRWDLDEFGLCAITAADLQIVDTGSG